MRTKQILIEKYLHPSEINDYGDMFWYNEYGELHNILGHPAIVLFCGTHPRKLSSIITINHKISQKCWYKNGIPHNDNGNPSIIKYNNDKEELRCWYKEGALHRDGDKPATISYDSNGEISELHWFKEGKIHREEEKPAIIKYKDGVITEQWRMKNGNFHQDDIHFLITGKRRKQKKKLK